MTHRAFHTQECRHTSFCHLRLFVLWGDSIPSHTHLRFQEKSFSIASTFFFLMKRALWSKPRLLTNLTLKMYEPTGSAHWGIRNWKFLLSCWLMYIMHQRSNLYWVHTYTVLLGFSPVDNLHQWFQPCWLSCFDIIICSLELYLLRQNFLGLPLLAIDIFPR